jgi:hypothetical protein
VVSVAAFLGACGRVSSGSHPTGDVGDARVPDTDADATGDVGDARVPDTDADAAEGQALSADDFEEAGRAITQADVEQMRRQACDGWRAPVSSLGARLFMLLDASSSMNEPAPGGGGQSKLQVVQNAVAEAITSLDDGIALGLLAYPNQVVEATSGDETACVNTEALVPVNPLGASDHRQTVIDALRAVEPNGCRPTHDAYVTGLEAMAEAPAAVAKYVLLMTDGQPNLNLNCEPGDCTMSLAGAEQPVIDEIDTAFHDRRAVTFLFGLPGSAVDATSGNDARWWLSQAAEAGGTSPGNCRHDAEPYCHYDLADDEDLAVAMDQALGEAFGQVDDCRYDLPRPPVGTVYISETTFLFWPNGGEPIQILRNLDPDCEVGWYYHETSELVRFCPRTCDLVRSAPSAELEIMVECGYLY